MIFMHLYRETVNFLAQRIRETVDHFGTMHTTTPHREDTQIYPASPMEVWRAVLRVQTCIWIPHTLRKTRSYEQYSCIAKQRILLLHNL